MDLTGALTADTATFSGLCTAGNFTTVGSVNAGTFNIDALDALPVTP